jgi:hypothetical protein
MTNTRQNIRAFGFGLAAAGFFAGFATPALAQPACGERNLVLKELAKQFSEAPAAMGLSDGGTVVELFSSPKGGTWTIVMTMPTGQSCMLTSGAGWENIPVMARGASL